jgi:hypothetical protein
LRNAVHNWVINLSLMTKELLRQQSKHFYAAGFDALAKRRDKCINVGGGHIEKHFFPRFEYHMFYALYQFLTHLLMLPHIFVNHTTVWMFK